MSICGSCNGRGFSFDYVEQGSAMVAMPGEPEEKLVVRVLVRMPEPLLQGVAVPCEEDPDWMIEEYALMLRKEGRIDKHQPFVRISLLRRMSPEAAMRFGAGNEQEILTRIAVVRFERDGTPHVVSR